MRSYSDGEVVKLFKDCYFGERSRIHILSTGILLIEGANGASSSELTKYYISDAEEGLKIEEIISYYFDEFEDSIDYEDLFQITSDEFYYLLDHWLEASIFDDIDWNEIASK